MGIYDILIEYKSIFGTILGSVVTLIVTSVLRNRGRIYFDFKDWNIKKYKGYNTYGSYEEVDDFCNTQVIDIKFTLTMYNSSESPKSLKEIRLEIKNEDHIVYIPLNDSKTKHILSGTWKIDELKIINLEPKQMAYMELETSISKEEIIKINNKLNKITFIAKNHNSKLVKKRIKNLDTRFTESE